MQAQKPRNPIPTLSLLTLKYLSAFTLRFKGQKLNFYTHRSLSLPTALLPARKHVTLGTSRSCLLVTVVSNFKPAVSFRFSNAFLPLNAIPNNNLSSLSYSYIIPPHSSNN